MTKHIHIHIHRKTRDAGEFREEDHPRRKDGKFGSGGGGEKKATGKGPALREKPLPGEVDKHGNLVKPSFNPNERPKTDQEIQAELEKRHPTRTIKSESQIKAGKSRGDAEDSDFKESEHPRDKSGKFGSGGGGGGGKLTPGGRVDTDRKIKATIQEMKTAKGQRLIQLKNELRGLKSQAREPVRPTPSSKAAPIRKVERSKMTQDFNYAGPQDGQQQSQGRPSLVRQERAES